MCGEYSKNIDTRTIKMPAGRKKSKTETRSKRVQLLLYPSTYNALAEKALDQDISFNELVNTVLLNYIKKNK